MLKAVTNEGKFISLLNQYTLRELLEMKETKRFCCPICNNTVVLKLGEQRIWHFSHLQKEACKSDAEAESAYHLLGKKILYELFKEQKLSMVEIEYYLSAIKQRPDIFIVDQSNQYAIEFQCANISEKLLRKRSFNYKAAGIKPIWILGGKRLKRIGQNQFKLTNFEWQFVEGKKDRLYLIYYCPLTNQFALLTNITPFSSQIFFANISYCSSKDVSFYELISPTMQTKIQWLKEWQSYKSRWRIRIQGRNYKDTLANQVKKMFYRCGFSLSHLPAESGLPIKSSVISTPTIIWQGWVLIEHIVPVSIGNVIILKKIVSSFQRLVKAGIFQMRRATYGFNEERAINDYLMILSSLRLLKPIKSGFFIKVRNIEKPSNLNELLVADEEVMNNLAKNYFEII